MTNINMPCSIQPSRQYRAPLSSSAAVLAAALAKQGVCTAATSVSVMLVHDQG